MSLEESPSRRRSSLSYEQWQSNWKEIADLESRIKSNDSLINHYIDEYNMTLRNYESAGRTGYIRRDLNMEYNSRLYDWKEKLENAKLNREGNIKKLYELQETTPQTYKFCK